MENKYNVVGLTVGDIERWELTAEQIHRNKESVKYAIICSEQPKVLLCFTDRSNSIHFANAMNYAAFCGLHKYKNLTVDNVRYSVFDMGQNYKLKCVNHKYYSTICSSAYKDTYKDTLADVYLKHVCIYDGAVVNVRYCIVDTKDSEYSACYFESYEIAMNFANAMNFAYLNNEYILHAEKELIFN